MPPSRPYLDMITRTLGVNANTVLRQGQACKVCGGFSPPFDSLDFFKYLRVRSSRLLFGGA